jgi:hypothetical protein
MTAAKTPIPPRHWHGAMRRLGSWSAFQFAYVRSMVTTSASRISRCPSSLGDLVATIDSIYRVVDVVTSLDPALSSPRWRRCGQCGCTSSRAEQTRTLRWPLIPGRRAVVSWASRRPHAWRYAPIRARCRQPRRLHEPTPRRAVDATSTVAVACGSFCALLVPHRSRRRVRGLTVAGSPYVFGDRTPHDGTHRPIFDAGPFAQRRAQVVGDYRGYLGHGPPYRRSPDRVVVESPGEPPQGSFSPRAPAAEGVVGAHPFMRVNWAGQARGVCGGG